MSFLIEENTRHWDPARGKPVGSRGKTGKSFFLEWDAPSRAIIALNDKVIRP